ncbi:hypothetical protein Dimus_025480 [Dionaea muscipula]
MSLAVISQIILLLQVSAIALCSCYREEFTLTSSKLGQKIKFVVGKSGEEKYRTINEALAAASRVPNNKSVQIHVRKGVYDEIVVVNRTNVELVGDGIGITIITGNRRVDSTIRTFNIATVSATKRAAGFIARRMTFRNTAGAGMPGVALRSSADRSAFHRCKFEGYQDTLYTHRGRQFYRECIIVGAVDFIFGNAAAVFQDTRIYLRGGQSGIANGGFITAQAREGPNDNSGFVFHHCKVIQEPGGSGRVGAYLGRPWKSYSRVVFMKTYLEDRSINPAGWAPWGGIPPPDTIYYAEYYNSGPASDTSQRVRWPGYHLLREEEALQFTVQNFLFLGQENWLSEAKIPFEEGL